MPAMGRSLRIQWPPGNGDQWVAIHTYVGFLWSLRALSKFPRVLPTFSEGPTGFDGCAARACVEWDTAKLGQLCTYLLRAIRYYEELASQHSYPLTNLVQYVVN